MTDTTAMPTSDPRVKRIVANANVPGHARPSAARAEAAALLVGDVRHLKVVKRPPRTVAQRQRRMRAGVLSGFVLIVGVAFGLVYLHVVLAQRQFALDNLQSQVQQQQLSYQKLRLQVADLGSPQHVISTAVGQLHMYQQTSLPLLSPSTTIGAASSSQSTSSLTAPAGDANWPQIKSLLAGSS
jgi:cell division protein FtsL